MTGYLLLFFYIASVASQAEIRGPPRADRKGMKVIHRIGDTVKITCPITGFPDPMIEWSKGGDTIDFTWPRYRTNKKYLKIKAANQDDIGIYVCKGINGFGSVQVRIDLIILDGHQFPGNEDILDAPPVFTPETMNSRIFHSKAVGDEYRVYCEALGSPQPEIFWFKNGQHISENIDYKNGRSSVHLTVMGTADSGVYTCRARNMLGEITRNYTLDVKQTMGSRNAIVTEAVTANVTRVGHAATLRCRVKAIAPPHIKWLKRLDGEERNGDVQDTLTVGDQRYLILATEGDVKTGPDEYLNTLTIPETSIADAGMYICFVTNSGFGELTYKSVFLNVVEKSLVPHDPTSEGEPLPILILVICLSVIVFLLLVTITVCVVRKRHKQTIPDSPEVQRPFMHNQRLQSLKLDHPLDQTGQSWTKLDHPLPTIPQGTQWSHTVYPSYTAHKTYDPRLAFGSSEHSHYEQPSKGGFVTISSRSPIDTESPVNQYEVPYAHLLGGSSAMMGGGSSVGSSDRRVVGSAVGSGFPGFVVRQPPTGGSSASGRSEIKTIGGYQMRQQQNYPFLQQYFNEYDSQ